MDLVTLEHKLSVENGLLDIDLSALDSPKLWAYLTPFFAGQPLLRLMRVEPFSVAPDRLTIRGAARSAPFADMELEVIFRPSEARSGELELELTATAKDTWNLAGVFPEINRTRFAGLGFSRRGEEPAAVLHLCSGKGGQAPLGMTLMGNATPTVFSVLGFLARAQEHYPLRGPLDLRYIDDPLFYPRSVPRDAKPMSLPGFRLAFALGPPESTSLPLRFENIQGELASIPRYDTAYNGWWLDASVIVAGDLMLGNGPQVRIPMWAELNGEPLERAIFHADLGEPIKTSLRGLSSLLGLEVGSPVSGLSLDDVVDLVDVELGLVWGPEGVKLQRLSCSVETREDLRWPLIEDLLTLDAIDLRLLVANPLSPASAVQVIVSGLVGVGETGTLRVSATLGRDAAARWEPTFHGSMVRGDKISVTEVFAHFMGVNDDDLPALDINTFSFELAPASKRYRGSIELAGIWVIPAAVRMELQSVNLTFDHEGEASTAFHIQAGIRVDACWIRLSADYEGAGHGWTFSGAAGGLLPTGMMLDAVARELGVTLPSPVQGRTLTGLAVRFNTATQDVSFHGTADFQVDGNPDGKSKAALTVHVDLRHPPGENQKPLVSFGGSLRLHGRDFAVAFDSAANAEDLLVASHASPAGGKVDLHDLVAAISTDVASLVPPGLGIALERAQLAFARKPQTPGAGEVNRFLFGIELGAGVELSKLPLVGSYFEPTQTLTVVVQLLLANASFLEEEIKRIDRLSGPAAMKLPAAGIDVSTSKVQVRTALRAGGKSFPLSQPYTAGALTPSAIPITAGTTQEAAIQRFSIQQAFGAFHFERAGIGLSADRQSLVLLFDASLQLSALKISLAGLGAELSLAGISRQELVPRFHLDGLGIDYRSGDLDIGGALLRKPIPHEPDTYEYEGAVVIHSQNLGITGFGSYASIDGHPSLFVYALVDYPLGGPSFFYVEGLAFGFGYNRSLTVPPFEQIETFPLVALARNPDTTQTPTDVAGLLARYLAPAEGEYFVTAGVKFNSFKTVDGFALLAVSFGRRFEIDVVGLATVSSPPRAEAGNQPRLMTARLGLRARYRPDEGSLQIQGGLLPDAHLFAESCHLSGGFAFHAWFKDNERDGARAGDFVLTMGGYHPLFQPPPHYPRVPRLALNWKVDESLSLKADAYFAVTPSAFMAGGHLRADWESDDLHAWFSAGVDCLVAWQPYHYDAELDVSIGASYRTWYHTFTVDLSAHLHVWGPPFSGTAHVKWWILSFDVAWGDESRREPEVPDWSKFREAFLPRKEDVLTVTAQAGKAAQHGKTAVDQTPSNQRKQLGVVNARELCIRVDSAIPVTHGKVLGTDLADRGASIGIAPMGKSTLDARIEISISPGGEKFSIPRKVEKSVPVALWGSKKPDLKEALTQALMGFEIRPLPIQAESPGTPADPGYSPTQADVPAPALGPGFVYPEPQGDVRGTMTESVQRPDTRKNRKAVLDALLPNAACDWSGLTVSALRGAPMLVRA